MKGGVTVLVLSCLTVLGGAGLSFAGEPGVIQTSGFTYYADGSQDCEGILTCSPEKEVFGGRAVLASYTVEARTHAQPSAPTTSATGLSSGRPLPEEPSNKGYEPLLMLMLGAGMIGFSEILRRTLVTRQV